MRPRTAFPGSLVRPPGLGDPTKPYAPAMALEPVEATLIAASVGAAASTSAVVITHLLTRDRDRRHKVWDRRMDTYKLLLRSRRDFAFARSQFLRTGNNPAGLINTEREIEDFGLINAELEMFGSTAVNVVDLATNIRFNQWVAATAEWRKLNSSPSSDVEAHREADEKWEEIKSLSNRRAREPASSRVQRALGRVDDVVGISPVHRRLAEGLPDLLVQGDV